MMRRVTGLLCSALLLAGALGISACKGKGKASSKPKAESFSCANVHAQQQRCASTIAEVMIQGRKMSPVALEAAKKKMIADIATDRWLKLCEQKFGSTEAADQKMQAMFKRCFQKKSCGYFAECLKKHWPK